MQLPEIDFLRLAEKANTIGFVDLESTGLRGDYNSVICGSVLRTRGAPKTFTIEQAGNDKRVVRELKDELETLDCWVTYYGKGFDIPMLNTRLLKWGLRPINKKPHIDLYFTLKYNVLTARKSQGHLLSWLETPEAKMTVSADAWNAIVRDVAGTMPTMIKRVESDVRGLRQLYDRTKHLIREIKR